MRFLELQRAILAHYIFFFAPLSSVMRNLAQGTAQQNPWKYLPRMLLMSTHNIFSSRNKKNVNFWASKSWLDK